MGARSSAILRELADGPLENQILGMCLSESGGAMSLGGINETWTPLLAPVQWTPYRNNYEVTLQGAAVVAAADGSSFLVDLITGNAAVDSGTTYTYFTYWQTEALRRAVKNVCEMGDCGGARSVSDECWAFDD